MATKTMATNTPGNQAIPLINPAHLFSVECSATMCDIY